MREIGFFSILESPGMNGLLGQDSLRSPRPNPDPSVEVGPGATALERRVLSAKRSTCQDWQSMQHSDHGRVPE